MLDPSSLDLLEKLQAATLITHFKSNRSHRYNVAKMCSACKAPQACHRRIDEKNKNIGVPHKTIITTTTTKKLISFFFYIVVSSYY